MDYKKVLEKKKRWWAEIKSFEQQYDRNLDKIKDLEELQLEISFKVQQRINNIQEIGEKYDNYCYENSVGEFSGVDNASDNDFDELEELTVDRKK